MGTYRSYRTSFQSCVRFEVFCYLTCLLKYCSKSAFYKNVHSKNMKQLSIPVVYNFLELKKQTFWRTDITIECHHL